MINVEQKKYYQEWRTLGHTPVIECPSSVMKGQPFEISLNLNGTIKNQDEEELRVRWVSLYFYPDGDASPYRLQTIPLNPELGSEEENYAGDPHLTVTVRCKVDGGGTLFTIAFCNLQEFFYSYKKILAE